MKRKKEDLEHVIQSLTKGEKYFITNTFKQSAKDAMYVSLYNKLQNTNCRTSKHDDQLKGKVLIDQKRFLYKTILKHLREMHSKLSHDITIQNLLAEVEILYNHSLADQAMLLLVKAKRLADQHEKFGLSLQILQWEQKLSIVLDRPFRTIDEIRKEEEEVLAKNAQINLLLGFYSQIMQFKKQHGFVKGTAKIELDEKVVLHSSFPSLEDCKTNKATYYFNLIFAVYHWMTFDHIKAFHFSQSLLKNDGRDILPSDFINGLFQHITSCVCLAKFNDVLQGIQLAKAFLEEYKLNQSHAYRQLFFIYDSIYKLIVLSYMGEKEKLKEVINHAERQLEFFGEFISTEHYQLVLGNIMNSYIVINDLDKAWSLWNQLFNKQFKQVRMDIYADLFLFRVLYHLQCNTYELLPSVSHSALRFYRKTEDDKSQFKLESSIVQLFTKEQDYSKPEVLQPLILQAQVSIKNYIKEIPGSIGFQEHYTRYIIWLEAIGQNIPYYEAAQQWYAVFKQEL